MISMPGEQLKYDVVVAGAGPAGSTFAYLASRMMQDLKIALVDFRRWENLWGKPCGDAISHHTFPETGVEPPRGEEVKQIVKGILIYSPDERTVFRVDAESGYIIDRTRLGQRLVHEAEERGVDVYLGARVLGPIVEEGRVQGFKARLPDGRTVEFRARLTIEATGGGMALKTRLPPSWPVAEPIDPEDTNIAYREKLVLGREIEEPNYIRIYLNQEIAPGGYWWYFPEGQREVNSGLGVQGGKGYPSPMKLFKERLLARRPELSPVLKVVEAGGAMVPTRRPSDTLVGPGIIVIGDAAYTVNPVHGGGMSYSMRAARYAAEAVKQAYEAGDWSIKTLWSLNTLYMSKVGARQASLDLFRLFLQRLSNDDLNYGMSRGLMRESDIYETSISGELKMSVVEKVSRIIAGLGRPSLLAKLKVVADYMKKIRVLYHEYPESPEGFEEWRSNLRKLYHEYLEALR